MLDHSEVSPDSKPSAKIPLSTVVWIGSLWSLRNFEGRVFGSVDALPVPSKFRPTANVTNQLPAGSTTSTEADVLVECPPFATPSASRSGVWLHPERSPVIGGGLPEWTLYNTV